MNKETIIKKLTSRKFIVSLIALASGIALLCGADGNTVETVSAALMILIPSLIYCITEGRLDKESINSFRDALDIIETATKRGDDDDESS